MMERKQKLGIIFLILGGFTLLIAGVSLWAFPEWGRTPGILLALIGAAFLAVAGVGGKLKDWFEFLFGKDDEPAGKSVATTNKPADPRRTQEVVDSEGVRQRMHGKGGEMKQKVSGSTDVEQEMD